MDIKAIRRKIKKAKSWGYESDEQEETVGLLDALDRVQGELEAATQKHINGYWACSNCSNVEFFEREVLCWKCGKGEMRYQDKEALRSFITQAIAAFKELKRVQGELARMEILVREAENGRVK